MGVLTYQCTIFLLFLESNRRNEKKGLIFFVQFENSNIGQFVKHA